MWRTCIANLIIRFSAAASKSLASRLPRKRQKAGLIYMAQCLLHSIENMLPDSELMICGSMQQFDVLWLLRGFSALARRARQQQTIIFPLAFVWMDFLFTANETEKCLFCIFLVPSSRLSHPLCYCYIVGWCVYYYKSRHVHPLCAFLAFNIPSILLRWKFIHILRSLISMRSTKSICRQ